jgi:hypothetical protein
VVELLEPFEAGQQPSGVSVSLNKAGAYPVYYDKENLVVEVKAHTMFAGYVYVDYFTTDRVVWHMFPNPKEQKNLVQPGSVLTVGDISGPVPWGIAPPFGLELVTVVTSKTPLFSPPRDDTESAEAFLYGLRQALARSVKADVTATLHFMLTQERR